MISGQKRVTPSARAALRASKKSNGYRKQDCFGIRVGVGGTAYAQTLLSLRDIGLATARSLVGSKGPPDLYSLPTRTLRYPYEGNPLNDPSRPNV